MTRAPSRPTALIEAVRTGSPGADTGSFTYTVLIDPEPSRQPGAAERRQARRNRTRLRSGKIVDARGRYVTDCLLHDLSATGVRLRLPAAFTLPAAFQVYDDQSGLLHNAAISWQGTGEAGVRFQGLAEEPRDLVIAADMRRRFYKLPR